MIEALLADRARAMAAHDGVPAGHLHVHGAANQLQRELLAARDRLMVHGVGPAATAESPLEAAEPEETAPPESDPAPELEIAEAALADEPEPTEEPSPEEPAPEALEAAESPAAESADEAPAP